MVWSRFTLAIGLIGSRSRTIPESSLLFIRWSRTMGILASLMGGPLKTQCGTRCRILMISGLRPKLLETRLQTEERCLSILSLPRRLKIVSLRGYQSMDMRPSKVRLRKHFQWRISSRSSEKPICGPSWKLISRNWSEPKNSRFLVLKSRAKKMRVITNISMHHS